MQLALPHPNVLFPHLPESGRRLTGGGAQGDWGKSRPERQGTMTATSETKHYGPVLFVRGRLCVLPVRSLGVLVEVVLCAE